MRSVEKVVCCNRYMSVLLDTQMVQIFFAKPTQVELLMQKVFIG